RAGVAEGTVYRRYKNKEALRGALFEPNVAPTLPIFAGGFS
ncbi:TetR family transcriptional regulator, partial [Lactiplantibacillus plantarum]